MFILKKIPLSQKNYTSTATDASDKYQVCAKVSNSYSIHFDSLTKELKLFGTLKEERAITLHYGEVEKLDSKW